LTLASLYSAHLLASEQPGLGAGAPLLGASTLKLLVANLPRLQATQANALASPRPRKMPISQEQAEMSLMNNWNDEGPQRGNEPTRTARRQGARRARLTRELLSGRYPPGHVLNLRRVADHYGLDDESVLKILTEFQALGMVTFSGSLSAIVQSPNPKEM